MYHQATHNYVVHKVKSVENQVFEDTRSCAALRAADLDWIVGPECSLGGKEEGVQGRNKQKRDTRGVTADLLDV